MADAQTSPQEANKAGKLDKPRKRWRRRLFRIALVLLLLVLAAANGLRYLADPARLTVAARTVLERLTGAQVSIDRAELNWQGIKLYMVKLQAPDMSEEAGQLFEARSVEVQHDLGAFLRGQIIPTRIVINQPDVYITENIDTGSYNYDLVPEQRKKDKSELSLPSVLPEVFVHGGQIHFGEVENDQYLPLDTLQVDGQLTADAQRSGWYNVKLRHDNFVADNPAQLTGRLNIKDLTFSAQLEGFGLRHPQRNMLPRKLRAWWDHLAPAGEFPMVRVSYSPDPAVGYSVSLQVKKAAVTLSYGEADFRMRDVSGRLTASNEVISIVGLKGRVEGVAYQIDGEARGLSENAPFHLRMRVDGSLPQEFEYLPAFPGVVQRQFQKFQPSGRFEGEVEAKREEPAGAIVYDGHIDVLDGRMRYYKVPYQLHDLKGRLRFSEKQIEVVDLHASGLSGTSLIINGTITPPRDNAEAKFRITGRDLLVDQHLLEALKPQVQEVIDSFTDQQAWQRLNDLNLVQTQAQQTQAQQQRRTLEAALHALAPDAQQQRDELSQQIRQADMHIARPVFEIGASQPFDISITREWGPGQPVRSVAKLDLAGASFIFSKWPYPLRVTEGTLIIQPPKVTLENITAVGPTGAVVHISGVIDKDEASGKMVPDVKLVIDNLPIDAYLTAAVPQRSRDWIAQMHLGGALKGEGTIFRDAQGRHDFDIQLSAKDATAHPWAQNFPLEGLQGRVRVQRDQLTLMDVTAHRKQATLKLNGILGWAEGDTQGQLRLDATELDFGDPVVGLIPPGSSQRENVRLLKELYKPSGRFDANLVYDIGSAQRSEAASADENEPARGNSFNLEIHPRSLQFDRAGERIALHDMTGKVEVTPGRMRFEKLGALFRPDDSNAFFQVDGDYLFEPHMQVDLKLEAAAGNLDQHTKRLLQPGINRIIDGLELDGAYHLTSGRVVYDQQADQDLTIAGVVDLTDANLKIGPAVTGLTGQLQFEARRDRGQTQPWLDVKMNVEQMLVSQRPVKNLEVVLSTPRHPELLEVSKLEGEGCGGSVVGSGEVRLAETVEYRFDLTLQGAELDQVLHPGVIVAVELEQPVAENPDGDAGNVSASLSLQGRVGEPETLEGRGRIEATRSDLMRVPLSMALWQMLSFNPLPHSSFTRGWSTFLISGDTVTFEQIQFEAANLDLVGSGTMKYSTREIDLKLHTANPRGPNLGAISDMMDMLKKEMISVRVTGTLDNPTPRAVPFSGVRESWGRVFDASYKDEKARKPKAEKQLQIEPQPPVSEPANSDQ